MRRHRKRGSFRRLKSAYPGHRWTPFYEGWRNRMEASHERAPYLWKAALTPDRVDFRPADRRGKWDSIDRRGAWAP